MILKGKVKTGIGDFGMKMKEVPGLLEAYERKIEMRFYPGTLNIELETPFSLPKERLRLEKEDYGGKVSVNILPCKIKNKKAFILRTDKNESGQGRHPKTVIEIASDERLRDKFDLNDGDEVEVEIK